ncbi:uncharacterized protein LOC111112419 [Crassostrea virginica]|nr:uncharacterized protein LOC111112419 isoform X2 [Crassostrea virginica]
MTMKITLGLLVAALLVTYGTCQRTRPGARQTSSSSGMSENMRNFLMMKSLMGPGGGMMGGNNLMGLMLLGGGEMLPMDDLMSMMMMRRMFSGDMGSTGPTTNTQG